MTRSLGNTVLPRVIAGVLARPVHFIRFAFGGGEVRVTTAPVDIDWDGFTWQAIGGALAFGAPRETPDDRGAQLPITLSGVDQSMLSAILAERYIGREIEIWLGYVAAGTNLCTNSSFETNTNGLGKQTGTETITRITDTLDASHFAARISLVNSPGSGVSIVDGVTAAEFFVTAGQPYFARLLAHSASAIVGMQLRIIWLDAGLGNISQTVQAVSLQPGTYQQIEVTGNAPSNAARSFVVFSAPSAPGTPDILIREVQFSPGNYQPYQPTDGAAIIGGTILDRPLECFAGFMNGGFEVTEQGSDREGKTVNIEGQVVSRLASLLQPRGFRTNRESHQTVYRTDQFFEFVPALANRLIKWGPNSKFYGTGEITPGTKPRDRR